MKKNCNRISSCWLSSSFSSSTAPQENTFYAGVKAGQASFHDGINNNGAIKKGFIRTC